MNMLDYMLKKIPSQDYVMKHFLIRPFASTLKNKKLWIIQRRSTANACFVGMFCAFTPWPLQMIQAALMSIIFRANIPLSVAIVWLTNPFTMVPIFYSCYEVGAYLIGSDVQLEHFDLSWQWLMEFSSQVWRPLLLGCLTCGLFFGSLFWGLTHLLWRMKVVNKWLKNHNTHPFTKHQIKT